MTFQYIRRRPHIPCYGNPFAAEWQEKDGVFVATNWNLFYWRDSPRDIFSIWEIGAQDTYRGNLYFKVKRADGSTCIFQSMELQLGAICHVSTKERLTVDELQAFKQLL